MTMHDTDALATSGALHERVRQFARGSGGETFEQLAWAIAGFQRAHVPSFGALFGCEPFGSRTVETGPLWQIPALPVEAMRFAPVFAFDTGIANHVFETSGTTSRETGLHYARNTDTYCELCLPPARAHLNPSGRTFVTVALMPLARENTRSSLAFMVRRLMEAFDGRGLTDARAVAQFDVEEPSRWLLVDGSVNVAGLQHAARIAEACAEPVLLFTTSFALVQLMDLLGSDSIRLPPESVVMPTGGFKGRTREVDPLDLYTQVQRKLGPVSIVQEYGMTELTSQLWERTQPVGERHCTTGLYAEPPTLRVIPVDPITLRPVPDGEPGLASFIDLGNVDSAVRILTEDRVVRHAGGIRLLGRSPRAALRGCSLAAESFMVPQVTSSALSPSPPFFSALSPSVAYLSAPAPSAPSRSPSILEGRLGRVWRLVGAARTLADPTTPQGKRLRRRLAEQGPLSPEGVEYALQTCLETHPSDEEVHALVRSVADAPRVWVVSSANVFVAAHRAIALGIAASDTVFVRPSTRDPVLTEALHDLCPELFSIVERLEPKSADHVYAYGADATMRTLLATLPPGVVLHAHGHGFGVVWLEDADDVASVANEIAKDAAAFDQRGCASPRVVALGPRVHADALLDALQSAFTALSASMPAGRLSTDESADVARFRLLAHAVADRVIESPSSIVALQRDPSHVLLPPVGRHLVLISGGDALPHLAEASNLVTTVAVEASDAQRRRVRELFPTARICGLGQMQRPPFDGPIDLRSVPHVVGREASDDDR